MQMTEATIIFSRWTASLRPDSEAGHFQIVYPSGWGLSSGAGCTPHLPNLTPTNAHTAISP